MPEQVIESGEDNPFVELEKVADLVKRGEPSPQISVRQLLSWFGAQRRGSYVVQTIRTELKRLGIDTVPDFNDIWIDSTFDLLVVLKKPEMESPHLDRRAIKFTIHNEWGGPVSASAALCRWYRDRSNL